MSMQLIPSKSIRAYLLSAMKEGEYADCDRLPRENVLAEKLGISRTQLRDILASLEREGFITRRHGIGTLINRHVLDVPFRMDIETEFLDMIRRSGFQGAVAYVRTTEDIANTKIAAQLRIDEGTPILRVARLCTADGKPAIYCEDVVDLSLVQGSYTEADMQLPIFHFLRERCGVIPYLDLTELHPAAADETLAEVFHIPVGTPLLNMEEVDFDIDGRPVFCSSEYFIDGIFHQTILRKRL